MPSGMIPASLAVAAITQNCAGLLMAEPPKTVSMPSKHLEHLGHNQVPFGYDRLMPCAAY